MMAAPKSGLQRDFEIVAAGHRAGDPGRNKRIIPRRPAKIEVTQEKRLGDAKSNLLTRERTGTWEDMKQILEENYATRLTIEYYACRLFNARQGANERVANWGSQVDNMVTYLKEAANWGSQVDTMVTYLKEAALRVCRQPQAEDALALVRHLAQACFVQGLDNERIQTIIRSKDRHTGANY
ncbi:hypothetical protein PR048_007126 [Dryococelus australis]|uniref:Uncharacterized protein n=1 Tax=Dryococelus australis TaxID=614101 RepID=A0ABQ9IDC5_9NEOP|nr:hypothetical protein PR048_007126 [Dryococelus australis]